MSEPIPQLAPSGRAPSTVRTAVGADDQCSWRDYRNVRCGRPATDTVRGKLYCSKHADLAAGV